jgi:ADP-heptose:LPS heptosyltransferase
MAKAGKIIIYRLGSLGDTVVALPCFHLIARVFKDYERILLTNVPVHAKAPAAHLVLGESGLIDGYMSYPAGTRNVLELAKLWWRIRNLKPSAIIYLTPPRGEAVLKRDERFFRSCAVKKIIGIPFGDLSQHRYDPNLGRYEAESARLARCLAPIGDAHPGDPASWNLLLTDKEKTRAVEALLPLGKTPFLVVGMASKLQATDWGIENWKLLMPKLAREFPDHAIAFIGAKEDHRNIEEVAALWPGKSLNVSGALTPRESAAVLQLGDLYMGLDSGPMHLASSVGIPIVGIFSARNLPGVWFPFGEHNLILHKQTECFGCGLEVCTVEKKKCLLSISAEEVVSAAKRALTKKQEATIQTTFSSIQFRPDGILEWLRSNSANS